MSNSDRDLKARLEELEAELNQKQVADRQSQQKIETVYGEIETETKEEAELISRIYSWLNLARNKFNSLSSGGKIIVGITAIWLSFTVLNLVLHLVTNLIVVGILGIFLYFAYQKLIAKS